MEKGDKRSAIIDAALELVSEHGFHGAPISLVAKKAGVAAGTIYHYFENKDDMIIGVLDELEKRILARVNVEYPGQGDVRKRYLHLLKVVVHYWIDHPLDFRFMEQFYNSPYGSARRREKLLSENETDLVAEIFETGRKQGLLKDLPLSILLSLTFGPLLSICRDHNLGFFALDELLIDQTIEGCWDAISR